MLNHGYDRDTTINIPNRERLNYLHVLFMKDDERSREKISHLISKSIYQVTSTTKTLGLSLMQQDGNMYDSVVLDADTDTPSNIISLVKEVFRHQPKTTIPIMVSRKTIDSNPILVRDMDDYLGKGLVVFMFKPMDSRISCVIRHLVAYQWVQIEKRRESTANKRPAEIAEEKPNSSKKICI